MLELQGHGHDLRTMLQRVVLGAQFAVIGNEDLFDVFLEETANELARRCELHQRIHQIMHTATGIGDRSEEHTSELQSLMRLSYAVFCLKKIKDITFTIVLLDTVHNSTLPNQHNTY